MVEPVTDVEALIAWHEEAARRWDGPGLGQTGDYHTKAATALRTLQERVTSLEAELDQAVGRLEDLLNTSLPDGFVAVPLEPTREMLRAASDAENFSAIHNYGAAPSSEEIWDAMLSARPTPPTEPPREWDMREATLNQSGCEVLIAFESAARACQFFDDVMEHPVLVPLPAPPKPLETER